MEKQNFISIGGKRISYRMEKVDIFKLTFYPENPRISSIISKHTGEVTEEFIDEMLWAENETHRLKRDIERDGGLIHPVIVYDNKTIEGNTRLCCFRHLYGECKKSGQRDEQNKWTYIDCWILLEGINKMQLYRLLCNEHITGKIQWSTYEKGNLLTKMAEQDNISHEEIKNMTGLSVPTIIYHIQAFKTMVTENMTDKRKYSHLVEVYKNAEIWKLKSRDPQIVEKIVSAIKNDQFGDAKDIRKVPHIYKDKNSRKRLLEYGEKCDQVFIDLKSKIPTIDSPFMRAIEDITNRMRNLTREEREQISKSGKQKYKIMKLAKESVSICKELDIEIHPWNL